MQTITITNTMATALMHDIIVSMGIHLQLNQSIVAGAGGDRTHLLVDVCLIGVD